MLGESDALFAALETASDHLAQRQVDYAVVVALCFANAHLGGTALGLRVRADGGSYSLDLDRLYSTGNATPLRTAIEMLRAQLD